LPKVAVRGDEAWDDPVASGVPILLCPKAKWRIACRDHQQIPLLPDDQVALDGLAVICGHGEDIGVRHHQFRGRQTSGLGERHLQAEDSPEANQADDTDEF